MLKYIITLFIALLSVQISAGEKIVLSTDVFVEKVVKNSDGTETVNLEMPLKVVPGDRLIFVLKYRNVGDKAANDFVVTTPLPPAVAFQETFDGTEHVSVDGGKIWGKLQNLKIRNADGTIRNAEPEDVTHIRWSFSSDLSVGSQGKLTFRGVVR